MYAVLYDVHGNLPALDAVLEDAAAAGAERYVLGGDYALFGPWPAETVARLRMLRAEWIRGNGERWTANPGDAPDDEVVRAAIRASRELLGEELVAELGALPESHLEGETRFVHGSPVSDVRSFLEEPADDEPELLAGVTEDRLVFGHTHIQFQRRGARGIELVNPGSVGMPFDGDHRAGYALVGDDGDVECRRVAYGHARSAAAVRERFPGFGETVARRIEQAAFVG
ncbi:MAG: metallophosphatase family protein [Actinomycetota bacterium]|nr:metallophosphatase family protein [Actinomycetota bacterium]